MASKHLRNVYRNMIFISLVGYTIESFKFLEEGGGQCSLTVVTTKTTKIEPSRNILIPQYISLHSMMIVFDFCFSIFLRILRRQSTDRLFVISPGNTAPCVEPDWSGGGLTRKRKFARRWSMADVEKMRIISLIELSVQQNAMKKVY